MNKKIEIEIEEYASAAELNEADRGLLAQAQQVTENAYAPYSHFHVGAVAQLKNGALVSGTNQENAAYPVGICAERTLLSAVASLYPGEPVNTLAISYNNTLGDSSKPVSPCGVCRQTLLEYEQRTGTPIRIILSGQSGKVLVVRTAKDLLPLSFTADDMGV